MERPVNPWGRAFANRFMIFLYGIMLGGGGVAARTLPVLRQQSEAIKKQTLDLAMCQAKVSGQQHIIDDQKAMLDVLEDSAGYYTVLYEPGARESSPLELLNLLRPGLGTILSKLSQSGQQPMSPHWIIPGHLNPTFNGLA
jgi:hypothetical protein